MKGILRKGNKMKAITKLLTPLISVAVLVGCSTSPFERCASEFTSRINAAEKQFEIVSANRERGYKVHASREEYHCAGKNKGSVLEPNTCYRTIETPVVVSDQQLERELTQARSSLTSLKGSKRERCGGLSRFKD